jgi:hypothetical protein
MGGYLSTPRTEKDSHGDENGDFKLGVSSMQGETPAVPSNDSFYLFITRLPSRSLASYVESTDYGGSFSSLYREDLRRRCCFVVPQDEVAPPHLFPTLLSTPPTCPPSQAGAALWRTPTSPSLISTARGRHSTASLTVRHGRRRGGGGSHTMPARHPPHLVYPS